MALFERKINFSKCQEPEFKDITHAIVSLVAKHLRKHIVTHCLVIVMQSMNWNLSDFTQ